MLLALAWDQGKTRGEKAAGSQRIRLARQPTMQATHANIGGKCHLQRCQLCRRGSQWKVRGRRAAWGLDVACGASASHTRTHTPRARTCGGGKGCEGGYRCRRAAQDATPGDTSPIRYAGNVGSVRGDGQGVGGWGLGCWRWSLPPAAAAAAAATSVIAVPPAVSTTFATHLEGKGKVQREKS